MSSVPRFWAVARRPQWIAALILVLVVAAAFAGLGRWQLERSVMAGDANEIDTETPVALNGVAEPAVPIDNRSFARMLEVTGTFDPASFLLLSGRLQHGEPGYWIVGRMIVAEPPATSLAVAVGWAATEAEAEAARSELSALSPANTGGDTWVGRYLPAEDPRFEDALTGERSALNIGDLINSWPGYSGEVYAGYLILSEPLVDGLDAIHAPPPLPEQEVNLLNLFYAIEWIIFGGFAIYLWWRLVKDEIERETDALAAAAGSSADTAQTPAVD